MVLPGWRAGHAICNYTCKQTPVCSVTHQGPSLNWHCMPC